MRKRHHHQRPHKIRLTLTIDGVIVSTQNRRQVHMATQVSVGHVINMKISFLDQNGNPMLTPVTPDSPPVWTNTTPATEGVVAAADGLSAVATPVAAGSDTVNLVVVVGGTSFSASLDVTVAAAAQVLTSVAIVPTVV